MDKRIKKVAFLGLFMAFLVIATTIFRFPVPTFNLYFNLGESVIYLVALIFGGPAGAIIGGVGSALSDVLGGYPVWAPITLVIKGIEGFIVGILARKFNPYIAVAAGAIFMMIGYATAAGILYGVGAVPVELAGDFVQVFIGGVIAIPLYKRLKNIYFNDENNF
ncbi:MAG: ECF transporter S component [Lutispora sp.]|nr:ECF transporter S component [Lutispora sp.]MDD4833803.1 ECF transporter S component [Lutispora sp.]